MMTYTSVTNVKYIPGVRIRKSKNNLLYFLFIFHFFFQYEYIYRLYWDRWDWLPFTDDVAASINQFVVLILGIIIVFQFLTKRRCLLKGNYNGLLLISVFYFTVFLSVINSQQPDVSVLEFVRFIKYLVFLLSIILIVQTPDDLRRYITFVVFLNLLIGIIAIPFIFSLYKEGTVVQKAGELTYYFLLFWVFYKNEKKQSLKILWGMGLIISSLSAFLSASRRFLLQLLIYIAAIFKKGRVLNPKKLAWAGLILILMIFYYQQFVPEDTQERIRYTIDPESEFQFWSGRERLWAVSWISFKERWLLGNGLRVTMETMSEGMTRAGLWWGGEKSSKVHNIYLELLSDTGVLGFISFMILLFYSLKISYRTKNIWQKRKKFFLADITYAYLWIWISLLIISFFGGGGPNRKEFWLYLAIIITNYSIAVKESSVQT